ncbi:MULTISPECIES: hypothetical protein [unclassified Escherichia]|uniref:F4 family fimbrial subunit n=1 Tax=unclassified Escherichia TaxID=2608889 RepID=UPI0010376BFC|nr:MULTISPECIES: hypothetical protein [unclassified Escherichia]TBR67275.1 hypothetical protein D9737_11740 [Escherichia sp. E10V4]TGC04049.1 hypothetical protein CRG92_00195 [Escherichia sp. E2586]TLI63977.1 hypothetical protein FEK50_22100 [Escherichia sp. E2586]
MKKTLIALVVSVSTAMSGSVMAADGSWSDAVNDFELSGSITVDAAKNIWEVYSGASGDLGGVNINSGEEQAVFTASKAIPVLGIRSVEVFYGQQGITPQINYGDNVVAMDSFEENKADFTLPVKDKVTNQEVGVLKTKLYAAGYSSYKNHAEGVTYPGSRMGSVAKKAGDAFFGGVPQEVSKVSPIGDGLLAILDGIIPGVTEHFDNQGVSPTAPGVQKFDDKTRSYSAYYGAGIQAGEQVTVTLNEAATKDINWTAKLPITVTYM